VAWQRDLRSKLISNMELIHAQNKAQAK
jgi:hypothetical protein